MPPQLTRLVLVAERVYRWRRKLGTAGVALMAAWLAWHVIFGPNGTVIYKQKRAEYRVLEKQIEDLQHENARLTREVRLLKSSPAAIEKEAREQLRYAKPGEVVYILPGEKTGDEQPALAKAAPEKLP